jgi:hypothetical protein
MELAAWVRKIEIDDRGAEREWEGLEEGHGNEELGNANFVIPTEVEGSLTRRSGEGFLHYALITGLRSK